MMGAESKEIQAHSDAGPGVAILSILSRKLLHVEDLEASYSSGILASIYWNQGRWTKVEQIFMQVRAKRDESEGAGRKAFRHAKHMADLA